jgi:hypothetical protein
MPVNVSRCLAFAFALGAASLAPATARADDSKEQCVAAHAESQKLRTDAKLQKAREKLLVCSRPECPGAVRSDCAKWLGEVQNEMPSLVVVATDANGNDVADVKVSVDGAVIANELNGQPLLVDPGQHTLRFERPGAGAIERSLLVRVGEVNRRVEVTFSPQLAGGPGPEPAGQSPTGPAEGDQGTTGGGSSGGGIPTMTWVLGGVGVLGLGSFTYFALNGHSKENDLDSCKPNCAHSDVQSAKTSYLIGDISLGVGVVALAGATYFLLSSPKPAKTGAHGLHWSVGLAPSPRGVSGVVNGSF